MKLKRFTLSLIIGLWMMRGAFAQNAGTQNSETQNFASLHCSQSEQRDKLIAKHPEVLIKEAELEAFTKKFVEKFKTEKSNRSTPIVIPIVFHIISIGGSENISDAQVEDEVKVMNRDYNKQNADTAMAYHTFDSIIADMGVEWRLAHIDPFGNCTNGIDRIISDQTNVGDDYSKLNDWPREKYMNVWVVKQMQGGAAGYAYYPGDVAIEAETPSRDGVIILNDYIGSIGTSSTFTSRALTHEIGHCFNLEHCWGNSNSPGVSCGDDGVDDTPITKGWQFCPSAANAAICNPPIVENYQNYMEYSFCSLMFTEGQKARWLAAANSPIAGRNNLWSDSNLIATGTFDTSASPCAPIADFTVNKHFICANGSVQFLNASGNGTITSYSWQFPTGTPATSTSASPTVHFAYPGWQTAILTVSNAYGSSTKSDSLQVFVGTVQNPIAAPFYEGFEDPNIFNNGTWASINYEEDNKADDNITWFTQVNYGAHTGTGAAMFNNYDAHANSDIDQIISPAFDLTGLSSSQMTLSFYYSLASFNQHFGYGTGDSLMVSASTTCGNIWQTIYSTGGSSSEPVAKQEINAGYVDGYFIPTKDPAYWKQVTVTIPSGLKQADVIFQFQAFTTIYGNNLYLDDINIGNAAVPSAIKTLSAVNSVNLYPNPTTGNSTLVLQLAQAGKVSVKIFDVAGKEAMNVYDAWMNEGETQLPVEGSGHLSAGVYIVNIVAGESVIQRKLVVQ